MTLKDALAAIVLDRTLTREARDAQLAGVLEVLIASQMDIDQVFNLWDETMMEIIAERDATRH